MNWKLRIAMLSTFLAMGFHAYLTWHYYPLNFAASAGDSFCNLSATLDCDAVSASRFSALFGIPMALWGLATNLILFLLLADFRFRFSETAERSGRWALALSGLTLLASIVMFSISTTQLGTYCLFCIGAYLTSIITFECTRRAQEEPFWNNFFQDFKSISQSKAIFIMLAFIPAGAFLTHKAIMQNYGADQIQRVVKQSIAEWQTYPYNSFTTRPSLSMGPDAEDAVLTVSEFADFRCGHCKHAAPSLHAFAKSNPDVRFEFYNFPLDGACNDAIGRAVGQSCQLAKAVHCAGEQSQKQGWQVHASIFRDQKYFLSSSLSESLQKVETYAKDAGLDWKSLQTCLNADTTTDVIRVQAKVGENAGVHGTPTIYADGRKLPRGQLIPVLEEARRFKLKQGK